jgi:hypothetical protein
MGRFSLVRSLLAFAVFVFLGFTPNPALAQRGGGHGGGGGGGFHGGGGGFHGSGGGFHGGGGGFHGSGGGFHGGGGYYGGGRSFGGGSYRQGGSFRGGSEAAPRGMGSRSHGGPEAGRGFGISGNRASNFRPAINDGQWHSFGNSGSSARLSEGRNSGSLANSRLSARNTGRSEGAWRSFGPSRVSSGFVDRASVATPGFSWRGNGWRGGWPRFGRCCGWGWGWGFGFGWPWWGGSWGLWNPWWYDPFWYAPWPAYSYYPDYSWDYDGYDPSYDPPYRDDHRAKPNSGTKQDDGGSVQNGQTPQPQGAPDSAAPVDPSPLVSESQT